MKTISELRKNSEIAIVVVDHQGIIIEINTQFNQVFGWQNDDVIGQPLGVIIPKNIQGAHHMGFSRFLLTQQSNILGQYLTLKAMRKNGEEFAAEHYIVAEKQSSIWFFAATIRPLDDK